MIRYNESLQVHPIEKLCRLHRLADPLNNVLLADMDNTSDQQKIQAEAHHLIIQHKEDNQGSHLQINMVSDLPPISLAGEQIRIPLLTDMDNTNEQREIRVEANHLIILPKEDQQVNHLQINMVNDHRQISLAGTQNLHTLADPLIETDNINDLHKKGIKGRQQSNMLIHPTEMHLHILHLVYPPSNIQLTGMFNINGRQRNQGQDRQHNQTKAPFLIRIQKKYLKNIPLIEEIARFR